MFVYSPHVTIGSWTPPKNVLETIARHGLAALRDAGLALIFALLDLHYVLAWPFDTARRAPAAHEPAPAPTPRDDRRATSRAFAAPPRGV